MFCHLQFILLLYEYLNLSRSICRLEKVLAASWTLKKCTSLSLDHVLVSGWKRKIKRMTYLKNQITWYWSGKPVYFLKVQGIIRIFSMFRGSWWCTRHCTKDRLCMLLGLNVYLPDYSTSTGCILRQGPRDALASYLCWNVLKNSRLLKKCCNLWNPMFEKRIWNATNLTLANKPLLESTIIILDFSFAHVHHALIF